MADYVHRCSYSIEACLSCQHRKSSHRPPKLPVGHRPVTRAPQCVAVDLVEYKHLPQGNRFILSVIEHFTPFVVLVPIKDEAARTIVCHLIERVFSVFGPPETFHSDQGEEFENELVKEFQAVFGYKKTRTAAFRPQGNSVLRACSQHCPQSVSYTHLTLPTNREV